MHSACSIWRAQSVTCPLRSPLIPAEGHSPQCLNPRMLWKLWCPTNHLPPETWGPVFTNCVSSDRSGCICCPIFCEKNNKIFNHQSHTENVKKMSSCGHTVWPSGLCTMLFYGLCVLHTLQRTSSETTSLSGKQKYGNRQTIILSALFLNPQARFLI